MKAVAYFRAYFLNCDYKSEPVDTRLEAYAITNEHGNNTGHNPRVKEAWVVI